MESGDGLNVGLVGVGEVRWVWGMGRRCEKSDGDEGCGHGRREPAEAMRDLHAFVHYGRSRFLGMG